MAAVVVGRFVADGRIKYGFAIVLAACYAPLVFINLSAALAVWVAVLFFHDLSFLSSAPNAIGVLVGLGWLGAFMARRGQMPTLRQHSKLLLIIVLFGFWLTLTIAWSVRPGPAGTESGYWWLCALTFLVVLTTLRSVREVRLIALAFIAGAVVSVLIGVATNSLSAAATATNQTALQGRLTGGGGDPNEQAAVYVAAMFLIIGLFSVYKKRPARIWLLLAFTLLTVGFIATESRGGLVALAVATIAALALSPRQRRRILSLIAIAGVAAIVLVAVNPSALHRITDVGGGTSGRSDLWRVGWDVFTGHPLFGIGIGNFTVVEAQYVLRPGFINRIEYLTDVPHVVHNTYLQLLAETGIVGLVGFLAVVGGSLRAAWLAIRRFESRGRSDYADLTRAVMMGTVGMLTALFFISDGDDQRLWILLALGPVLLTLASSAPSSRPPLQRPARGRGGRPTDIGLTHHLPSSRRPRRRTAGSSPRAPRTRV